MLCGSAGYIQYTNEVIQRIVLVDNCVKIGFAIFTYDFQYGRPKNFDDMCIKTMSMNHAIAIDPDNSNAIAWFNKIIFMHISSKFSGAEKTKSYAKIAKKPWIVGDWIC